MFKNIGKKIKVLAKVLCWIGIVCSIIIGLLVIIAGLAGGVTADVGDSSVAVSGVVAVIIGIFIIIFGVLCSWIGSFTTYGFGEIVDNVKKINDRQDLMS